MTHICVSKLTIIGSDNGLSPGWCQAIILTNAGILSGPLGTNFTEIIEFIIFSFNKMHLKMSAIYQPFCLSLNVLKCRSLNQMIFCRQTSVMHFQRNILTAEIWYKFQFLFPWICHPHKQVTSHYLNQWWPNSLTNASLSLKELTLYSNINLG